MVVLMTDLAQIPDLEATSLELLEAVGFRRLEEIAESREDSLFHEIENANRILKLAEQTPSHSQVVDWVRFARMVTGVGEAPSVERESAKVIEESMPRLSVRLQTAPLAIPLPGSLLQAHGLTVPAIPPGVFAKESFGEEEHCASRVPVVRTEISGRRSIQSHHAEHRLAWPKPADLAHFKSIHEIESITARLPKREARPMDERVAVIRAPMPETNQGVNPKSRRYVRGVLHNRPFAIYSGAVLSLWMMGLAPVAVVSSVLLLLSREQPKNFGWVPSWYLVFPLALPLMAICWAIWGWTGSCRICGQKLFVHRAHRKNAKAHHIAGLGYIFPLCIHILLFRWFRCTHCGTPVRLKK